MGINKFENLALIYSCIIATIALLWNIIESIKNNRRKLRIKYTVSGFTQIKSKVFGLFISVEEFTSNIDNLIEIQITNISLKEILIYESIQIYQEKFHYFKKSIISSNIEAIGLTFSQPYPFRLLSGEKLVLIKSDMNLSGKNGFRILIKDSHGKIYKSGKFKNIAC